MSPRRQKPEAERRREAVLEMKREVLAERLDRFVKGSRVPEFRCFSGGVKGRTLGSAAKAAKREWQAAATAQITQLDAAKMLMEEFGFQSPGALLMWLSRQKAKAGKKTQAAHTRRRRRVQSVISRC